MTYSICIQNCTLRHESVSEKIVYCKLYIFWELLLLNIYLPFFGLIANSSENNIRLKSKELTIKVVFPAMKSRNNCSETHS